MGTLKNKVLDKISSPKDLKRLNINDLQPLANELRGFIIRSVSRTGGHLGASLGAIELTIALHYIFDSPKDKIVWDVGHQSYAHKILTGRKKSFHTLRQYQGLSGFPKIKESEHDIYGTGHASTSISAALGMCKARDLTKKKFEVIAVIGDGALTGGNALEAINQAGYLNTKIIIILNDNRMSISPNVGAISEYTHRIEKTEIYKNVRNSMNILIEESEALKGKLLKLKQHLKEVGSPGLLFEKLGLNYIGPIDGHDCTALLGALGQAKKLKGPCLIRVKTVKGKGYSFAEENKPKFHGVNPFNIENGVDLECANGASFTQVFGNTLTEIATKDPAIVAISAAMPDGTGLAKFKERFPRRFFDVGIAEQHAVVFAAGLARQGLKPVCAIYSTFLQRAYDAIVHDVCLQNLPVVFAIDRAGLVGNDGPTHHGAFDLSYMRHIPNLIVMAPKDGEELRHMLYTAVHSRKPVAVRYPRGECFTVSKQPMKIIKIGKAEMYGKGKMLSVISIGNMFRECLKAVENLNRRGIQTTLVNARYIKPLDTRIADIIRESGKAIVVEESARLGGFGSAIMELCQEKGVKADIKSIGIPDHFVEQGSQDILRRGCGLYWENVVKTGVKMLGRVPGSNPRGCSGF